MTEAVERRGLPAARLKGALARGMRDPRVLQVALGALALAAVGSLWGLVAGRRADSFPRRDFEFLPAPALEAELKAAGDRLKADPQDLQELLKSGLLHFQRGKDFYPDAINELEEARKLGALDDRIFYYLGAMYQEEGLYNFAIPEYQKFLRNRPEDLEGRLLLAKLLYQNGRYAEAVVHYRWLRGRHQRDPLVLENLGLCLLNLKENAEAAGVFDVLATMGAEQSRRAHVYLGQIAFDAGDYQKAAEHFDSVLPLDGRPDLGLPPAAVHAAVGAVYEKLGRLEPAKEHWDAVLKLDPKNQKAKIALKPINAALKAAKAKAQKEKAAQERAARQKNKK